MEVLGGVGVEGSILNKAAMRLSVDEQLGWAGA
jgi:hypothetical protein